MTGLCFSTLSSTRRLPIRGYGRRSASIDVASSHERLMGATRDLSIATLDPLHDRKSFTCGTESLDRYLKTQASQDQRRKANGVFVMTAHEAPERVLGFYTLCATALSQGEVPESAKKLVPRYPLVSATLIGRLAVATERQGQGLGGILLTDALRRAYASAGTVGSSLIVVDALDERAIAFYLAHGFVRLPDSLKLVLPMSSIAGLTTSSAADRRDG